ncbi:hypothetical protein [Winogradskyella psychrotolerans]|uniref:hypothetical protein n=1 Tax=Winogradskyella psychrotolerans TaxID=1344585 RepID=UPI001F20E41B|nr:hypothetical protein [Winogradskyella psychrotolerans]
MTKVILISQFPLPYHRIGSWTTMYKNYLESDHSIDFVVCERPVMLYENINYSFIKNSISIKIKKKLLKNYYLDYLYGLNKIIKSDEKYIIQVVDNFGLVKYLNVYLKNQGVRENCHIQFFFMDTLHFIKILRVVVFLKL